MSTDSASTFADSTFVYSAAPAQTPLPPVQASATPVRVLHVINGELYSGAERVQDLLALRLPEHGFQVGFACLKPGRFADLRRATDAPVHDAPMKRKFDFSVVKRLTDLVRREHYELIHAHTPRSCMISRVVASRARVPLVYHLHSPTSHDSSRTWTNRINAWVERLSLTGVSRMIAVSESLARHMSTQGYNPDLISVVPNGVPCASQLVDRPAPSERWVLGTTALFRPRKGIEVLIEALSILRGYGYDVRLRAVGAFESAAYEAAAKSLVKKMGVEQFVEWTGFARDVDAELARMDLFVLPSLFGEGLPMVILEAMAAGVPVVATRVAGIPEVLREGDYGVLAAPGCAADLARGIRQVIRGEVSWAELRENAFLQQAEHYSDVSMAAGVAAAYHRVLRSAPAASSHELGELTAAARQ